MINLSYISCKGCKRIYNEAESVCPFCRLEREVPDIGKVIREMKEQESLRSQSETRESAQRKAITELPLPEQTPKVANDYQIGGSHYKEVSNGGEQHWDMMWRLFREAWFIGCITKYIFRYRKKNGIEDLKKARHYLDRLIELEEKDATKDATNTDKSTIYWKASEVEFTNTLSEIYRNPTCSGDLQGKEYECGCKPNYISDNRFYYAKCMTHNKPLKTTPLSIDRTLKECNQHIDEPYPDPH